MNLTVSSYVTKLGQYSMKSASLLLLVLIAGCDGVTENQLTNDGHVILRFANSAKIVDRNVRLRDGAFRSLNGMDREAAIKFLSDAGFECENYVVNILVKTG